VKTGEEYRVWLLGSQVREYRVVIDQHDAHIFHYLYGRRYVTPEIFLGLVLLYEQVIIGPVIYYVPRLDEVPQSLPE
jgi:hypothetical protein